MDFKIKMKIVYIFETLTRNVKKIVLEFLKVSYNSLNIYMYIYSNKVSILLQCLISNKG